jgi:hypothetical protein
MSHPPKLALFAVCVAMVCALPALAANTGAAVIPENHHDLSAPLRSMVHNASNISEKPVRGEHAEFEGFSKPVKVQIFPDNAMQGAPGSSESITSGLNLAGVGQGDYGYQVTYPAPDANGAVGTTQYVQSVASSFAVFDKKTGALLLGPASINTLFAGFGGSCETTLGGDSAITFDKLANRWVISTMADRLPTGEGFNTLCMAVSQNSDATGSFYRYSVTISNIDYQKIGVWPDGYYVGLNNPANTTATACALDRNAMLNGSATTSVCFTKANTNTLLPADLDGKTAPAAGAPNYFLGGINHGKNVLNLFKFHVDFANTKNSTFTAVVIPVAPYTPSCVSTGGYYRACVPQKGSSTKLETLSDRVMYRNVYRNFGDHESLVINHAVDVNSAQGSRVGIRWYELRSNGDGNFTVSQQGTYSPDQNSRFMGSIAMDKAGDIALGYGISSSRMYPSVGYSGRVPTDPAGTLGGEQIFQAGGNATSNTLWGDYTSMSVDPTDDCTFFYTSEYYKTGETVNWSTRIASFKFAGCK